MDRRILTILLILFYLTSTCQTSEIFGYFYDGEVSKPIKFASVLLIQKEKVINTDLHGFFKFANLPHGLYNLKFVYLGYGDTTIVNISTGKDTLKFNLSECCCLTLGGPPECPVCKKSDMTVPVKYGTPNKKDIDKLKKGQVYLIEKASRCHQTYFCKRDSRLYN